MSTIVAGIFGLLALLYLYQTANFRLDNADDAFRETAE